MSKTIAVLISSVEKYYSETDHTVLWFAGGIDPDGDDTYGVYARGDHGHLKENDIITLCKTRVKHPEAVPKAYYWEVVDE